MLRPILLASARNDINRIHTLFNNNALFKCLHYVDDFFVEVGALSKTYTVSLYVSWVIRFGLCRLCGDFKTF